MARDTADITPEQPSLAALEAGALPRRRPGSSSRGDELALLRLVAVAT